MIKIISFHILFLISTSVFSQTISQFNGSLFMLDQNGSTAFVNNQCPSCDSLTGEIDQNLNTLINTTTGLANDITGTHDLLGVNMNWSLENLSFVTNQNSTVSISGDFLWTNSSGLTTSTFTQLAELQNVNSNLIALDGDSDLVKGNTLLDGPFKGHSLYLEGTISTIPVPAAFWLMTGGLFVLSGLLKRKSDQ